MQSIVTFGGGECSFQKKSSVTLLHFYVFLLPAGARGDARRAPPPITIWCSALRYSLTRAGSLLLYLLLAADRLLTNACKI